MQLDLNDLYYFVKSVEHGGFSAAERALGIPKSRLSRRISTLEETLGVQLIQRSTRQFRLTDLGETYFTHCKAMLIEAEAAQEAIDLARSEPKGVIKISCPRALLQTHVSDMLARFMLIHPKITIQLLSTNRAVDLIGEGIDIALRVRSNIEDSELVMRQLGTRTKALFASPILIDSMKGMPESLEELLAWPLLAHSSQPTGHSWTFLNKKGDEFCFPITPRYMTTDMDALKQAALAGVGVIHFPHMLLKNEVARGELVKLLPELTTTPEIIHAVFPSRRGLLPSVRALIDFLVAEFETICEE